MLRLHHYRTPGGPFRTLNAVLHTDRLVPVLIVFNLCIALHALCPH